MEEDRPAEKQSTVEKIKGILQADRDKKRAELAVIDAQLRLLEGIYIDLMDIEKIIDLARRFDRGELGPVQHVNHPPTEGA